MDIVLEVADIDLLGEAAQNWKMQQVRYINNLELNRRWSLGVWLRFFVYKALVTTW